MKSQTKAWGEGLIAQKEGRGLSTCLYTGAKRREWRAGYRNGEQQAALPMPEPRPASTPRSKWDPIGNNDVHRWATRDERVKKHAQFTDPKDQKALREIRDRFGSRLMKKIIKPGDTNG